MTIVVVWYVLLWLLGSAVVSTLAGCSHMGVSPVNGHLEIPGDWTTIGVDAYRGCAELVSVNMPSSVLNVSYGAFALCSSLREVNFSRGLVSIFGGAYRYLGLYGAFQGCGFESINLPDTLMSIGQDAFRDNKHLKNVTLGKSLISIGRDAFSSCDLRSLHMPDTLKEIGG